MFRIVHIDNGERKRLDIAYTRKEAMSQLKAYKLLFAGLGRVTVETMKGIN